MNLTRSWQFIGGPESAWYRAYDWLRRRVNARLVSFLVTHMAGNGEERTQCSRGPAPGRAFSLEAGSGTAFASSLLGRRTEVRRAVCLDVDLDALIEARRRDPNLLAVVADVTRMPFPDGTFSLVFNSSTVEHLDAPDRAVNEMQRVCAERGLVFVGVPYLWGPLWFQPLIRGSAVGAWLGTVFTRNRLESLLREASLTPMAHVRYFHRFFIGALAAKEPAPNKLASYKPEPEQPTSKQPELEKPAPEESAPRESVCEEPASKEPALRAADLAAGGSS